MSESVFRKAAPAAPVAPPAAVAVDDKPVTTNTAQDRGAGTEPAKPATPGELELFSTYEEAAGRPLAADYFEIPNLWDENSHLARDLQEIEGYVRQQLRTGTLENSVKAAKDFIKQLERDAGLTRYESTATRIQKLLAYIDFKRIVSS